MPSSAEQSAPRRHPLATTVSRNYGREEPGGTPHTRLDRAEVPGWNGMAPKPALKRAQQGPRESNVPDGDLEGENEWSSILRYGKKTPSR